MLSFWAVSLTGLAVVVVVVVVDVDVDDCRPTPASSRSLVVSTATGALIGFEQHTPKV